LVAALRGGCVGVRVLWIAALIGDAVAGLVVGGEVAVGFVDCIEEGWEGLTWHEQPIQDTTKRGNALLKKPGYRLSERSWFCWYHSSSVWKRIVFCGQISGMAT
jgi:hypothetical protein